MDCTCRLKTDENDFWQGKATALKMTHIEIDGFYLQIETDENEPILAKK